MHWRKNYYYVTLTPQAQLIVSNYMEKYSLWGSSGLGSRFLFWVRIWFTAAFTVPLKFRLLIWADEIFIRVRRDHGLDFGWWNNTDVSFYTVGNIQLGSLSNILDAVIKNRDANKNKRILRLTVRRLQAASVFWAHLQQHVWFAKTVA